MSKLSQPYPLVQLGKVVQPVNRGEEVKSGTLYRQIGVRLWGQGAYERETIDGRETQYKTLNRVETDDIIVNKIWARNGSVAVVSTDLAGCYGSGEFPTFSPDTKQLCPRWFHWITKTKFFWQACDEKSRGTSGKNRIRPDKFLEIEIPLPPLDEQQRIVARIEALAGRVAEAQRLRSEAMAQMNQVVSSLHQQLSANRTAKLGDMLILDEDKESITAGGEYPQVGVRGFGNGLFAKESISDEQTSYKHFNRLYKGALVLSQVKGWEGAIAVADKSFAGKFVSPEYRTFRCVDGMASPDYLARLVVTPWFWTKLAQVERGLGGRRQRTKPEQFLALEVPMPTYEQQLTALPVFRHLDKLRPIQAATQAELDALLLAIVDKAFRGIL